MSQQQRFAGLRAVLHAVSLSLSARVVYFELDDRAGVGGHCWPRQHTISACTGISERAVRDAIAELAEGHFIETKRGQRGLEYFLCWKYRQILPVGSGEICRSERQILPVRAPASLYEPTHEPKTHRTTVCHCGEYFEEEERTRCRCGAVHDPSTATEVDPLEETRKLLFGYVQQCRLPWPEPDDEICYRTLDAAGSIVVLVARLRFLLLDRRLAPRESYGWFPRVCASERKLA